MNVKEFVRFIDSYISNFESVYDKSHSDEERFIMLNKIGGGLLQKLHNNNNQVKGGDFDIEDGFMMVYAMNEDYDLACLHIYCNNDNQIEGVRVTARIDGIIRHILLTSEVSNGFNYPKKLPNGTKEIVEKITQTKVKDLAQ